MPYKNTILHIFLVCFLVLVTACGGGSDSPAPTVPDPDPTPNTGKISGTPLGEVKEAENYSFTVSTTGFSSTSLSYEVINKPSWATFDDTNGRLTGTPSYSDAGDYTDITITASDGKNSASLATFSIRVIDVNTIPYVNTKKAYSFNEIEQVNLFFDVKDIDGDSLTVTATNLPNWLEFLPEQRVLEGIPDTAAAGEYAIELVIDDGRQNIVTETILITVNNVEFDEADWFTGKNIELVSASDSGLIYAYIDSSQLVSFDSNFGIVLDVQEVTGVSEIVYHENHQRLYLGFTNGNIKTMSVDFVMEEFASVTDCVNDLVDASNFLIALDCDGYSGTYSTINNNGVIVANSDNYYNSSQENAWNEVKNRLYHFRDGISPNDIHYRTVDSSGNFSDINESPYHGDYNIAGPIVVSNDGTKVLLGSGDIYNADDLTIHSSIATSFDNALWLSDGSLLLITDNSTSTLIQRLNENYQPIETTTIEGSFQIAHTSDNSTLIVTNGSGGLNVHHYIPNDDVDDDGVENTEDAFPTDSAASMDSDFDGAPDSWNSGKTAVDSTTGLSIDFFPLDSACWLSEHAVEGNNLACDYAATMPIFSPDEIIGDVEGNIYLLNKAEQKIYRWLSATQAYGNPIGVTYDESSLNKITYSEEHNRIYVGYASGNITYIELEALSPEQYFATIAQSVNGLASVGDYVLVQDDSGAWESHYIFDKDGQQTDKQEWNHYSETYAWNQYNSRVYFFRDTSSPNDLLYEEINQSIGSIDSDGDSPYHSDAGIRHPIRVFNNGTQIILGSGNIYDADTLVLEDSLTLEAIDIATTDSEIISLEDSGDDQSLTIWHVDTLQKLASMSIEGTPLKLFNNGKDISVVSLLDNGTLHFEILYLSDADSDGIPQWWEDLYGLDDTHAPDASLDNDEDGLTNLQEYELTTNPNIADTDEDGISDGDEVNVYLSSPLNIDSDDDGISDGVEVNSHATNPAAADSDDDGLTDFDEINTYASNPLSGDSDNDGISDFIEISNNLDINVNDANDDSDLDGLLNIDELAYDTGINNSDSDNDGLTDGDEVHLYSTVPVNRDTDGDEMSDGWELSYGLDPLDASDAVLDSDDDSYSNLKEFYLVSNPTDVNDTPVAKPWNSYQGNADNAGFIAITVNSNDLSYRWSTWLPGEPYSATSVVATQGKVFASIRGYLENKILALSSINGGVVWEEDYGDINAINAPSFSGDNIYFQTGGHDDSYLHSLNVNDGSEVFSSSYGNQWYSYQAPTIYENSVYVAGGYYGGAYSFNAETGTENWFEDLAQCDSWVPAVNEDNVFYYDQYFKVADKATGDVITINTSHASQYSECRTPVLGHEQAYINTDNGLYAFDTETAELVWHVENTSYHQSFSSTPAVALGKVYALKDGVLTVYNEFTGEELWDWQPTNNARLTFNIALTLNIVFVSDSTNTYAIDITSKQQVWSYPVSGQKSLSLEGALYIQSDDGVITAINIAGDTDEDGIDDWWEELYGFDVNDNTDAALNTDSDDLTNLEEFIIGTNPLLGDTDADGINDSEEVNTYLSNPTKYDTDDDGMPDLWEVEQGFDLLNANDALLDSDDDSISNLDEYQQATDPNDALSIPDIISSVNYSFEDGLIPDDWLIDQTLESGWGISLLESSDGDYSIFASGSAAISFSGYFAGNTLSFDAKNDCGYTATVYIDGQGVDYPYGATVTTGWNELSVLIPAGQHTIRIELPSCGDYFIDNVDLSPIDNLFVTETYMVTTANDQLKFFNAEGQWLMQVEIPKVETDYASEVKDAVILSDGRVAIYNGTIEPSLSIYSPEKHQWQHITDDEWSTSDNERYGGIATNNSSVYVTNMDTSNNDSSGFIKIDLESYAFTYIDGESYLDLTIGLDGFLYAMTELAVDKYDLETDSLVGTTVISSARSLAVDASGNIFTASANGDITQYSSTGVQQKTINIDEVDTDYYIYSNLQDIDINSDGDIYVTNTSQQVLLTDITLNSIALYFSDINPPANFLTLLPVIGNDDMP